MTDPNSDGRRERYAEALYATLEVSPQRHPWATLSPLRRAVWYDRADAAMTLADAELSVAASAGQAPATDRATLLRELADQQEATAATDVIRRRRNIATARRLFAVELRRAAAGAQQPKEA